ncbi:phosphoribosylglycinamide formyltransferase [Hoyosella rhizosphaerae]|uniref:Phosphoribosylglycinamide formyltransferase n=2 Tax=Hoyosella rhizosphaerae TaxID=1755582 RepID=A0A916XEM4_9ACTN|nr:phosphoribosylglycinamide formyltransferase [Hoyosella rhizosphaerae]GGC67866.1 phosphoribosylglycinamide formyltransferase [Hoyosella rhizosphaerae]
MRETSQARIVVLASGSGTLCQALLDAAAGEFPARVVGLVTDRACEAENRAKNVGVQVTRVALGDFENRQHWDQALADAVKTYAPTLVVTAGFMRLLGPSFLGEFPNKIVNSHPALLPAFPGAHAVRDALHYGVRVTGTTVHLVDEGVDTGPILAQEVVPVGSDDTESTLHERIKKVERRLLVEVVADLVTRGVVIDGRKAMIP